MRMILTFIAIFFSALCFSQKSGSIKGIAFDTSLRQPVPNATVTLLKKKDSSLVSFAMADNNGRFELSGIANGDYRLMITHVNYHNSNRNITIDNQPKDIDLGNM